MVLFDQYKEKPGCMGTNMVFIWVLIWVLYGVVWFEWDGMFFFFSFLLGFKNEMIWFNKAKTGITTVFFLA